MTLYFAKASACLALFYLLYYALFRHTVHFQWNRAYLNATLILSFLLPVVALPFGTANLAGAYVPVPYLPGFGSAQTATPGILQEPGWWIPVVYVLGVVARIAVTIASLAKTMRWYREATKVRGDSYTVALHPRVQAFSFFRILFLPNATEHPMVVEHELTHIRQRHWIDLVVAEVAVIVAWFNPFVYLYQRSIAQQHEYLADRHVVSQVPVGDYLACLVQKLESNLTPVLTNRFNTKSIKQRVMMMTTNDNDSRSPLRYFAIVPVLIMATMAFTSRVPAPGHQDPTLRIPVASYDASGGQGTGFGKRIHPVTGKEVFHSGFDFVAPEGERVYAAADGVVVEASTLKDRGNFIVVMHNQEISTTYSHLQLMNVKEGDRVKQGQEIGLVGNTGMSSGAHLHFEVLRIGKAVDPASYLGLRNE